MAKTRGVFQICQQILNANSKTCAQTNSQISELMLLLVSETAVSKRYANTLIKGYILAGPLIDKKLEYSYLGRILRIIVSIFLICDAGSSPQEYE